MQKPEWRSGTETTATIRIVGDYESAVLEYKEYHEEWTAARSTPINDTLITVPDLNPGSTYNFRLAQDGEHGPDLVVDTQAPGCTPKPKRCCLVS